MLIKNIICFINFLVRDFFLNSHNSVYFSFLFYRVGAHQARVYCEDYLKVTGKRLTIQPFICGYLFSCCGNVITKSLDAIDYYTSEEDRLLIEVIHLLNFLKIPSAS